MNVEEVGGLGKQGWPALLAIATTAASIGGGNTTRCFKAGWLPPRQESGELDLDTGPAGGGSASVLVRGLPNARPRHGPGGRAGGGWQGVRWEQRFLAPVRVAQDKEQAVVQVGPPAAETLAGSGDRFGAVSGLHQPHRVSAHHQLESGCVRVGYQPFTSATCLGSGSPGRHLARTDLRG